MAYDRMIWENRNTEYESRYLLVDIETGTSQLVEIEPVDGAIYTDGVPYNATTFNNFEGRIAEAFEDAENETNKKAPINHASTTTTYGVANASNYGHPKLTDTYASNGGAASSGIAASGQAVYNTYNTLNTSKAPNNHASTATTYGPANASNYGHTRLSASTSSTSGVDGGYAATPSAVKSAYDLATTANTLANTLNGNTVKTTGNQTVNGTKTFSDIALTSIYVKLGSNTSVSGLADVAIGNYATASTAGTAVGAGAAAPNGGVALGGNASAGGSASSAIGWMAATSTSDSLVVQIGGSEMSALRSYRSLTIGSDIRDKADVAPIESALPFLSKIPTIQYVDNRRVEYMSDREGRTEENEKKYQKYGLGDYDKEAHAAGTKKGERKRAGVSAQGVIEALVDSYGSSDYADLVNDNLHDVRMEEEIPDDVESQLTVNYTGFIPFLIKGEQELDARYHEMRGEIDELRKLVEQQQKTIEILSSKISG